MGAEWVAWVFIYFFAILGGFALGRITHECPPGWKPDPRPPGQRIERRDVIELKSRRAA
jgi:hypothetical protein